jgi:hypothetical protein
MHESSFIVLADVLCTTGQSPAYHNACPGLQPGGFATQETSINSSCIAINPRSSCACNRSASRIRALKLGQNRAFPEPSATYSSDVITPVLRSTSVQALGSRRVKNQHNRTVTNPVPLLPGGSYEKPCFVPFSYSSTCKLTGHQAFQFFSDARSSRAVFAAAELPVRTDFFQPINDRAATMSRFW